MNPPFPPANTLAYINARIAAHLGWHPQQLPQYAGHEGGWVLADESDSEGSIQLLTRHATPVSAWRSAPRWTESVADAMWLWGQMPYPSLQTWPDGWIDVGWYDEKLNVAHGECAPVLPVAIALAFLLFATGERIQWSQIAGDVAEKGLAADVV